MCHEGSKGHCGPGHKHGHGHFPKAFMHGFGKMMGHHWKQCCGMLGNWIPHNLEDKEDSYLITIPIPGRTKEDVTVSLIGRNLNVTAKKPKDEQKKEGEETKEDETPGFLRKFFKFINVNMDIPLPTDANEESIKSAMAHGVLKIRIGKKEPKNININDDVNN